MGSAVFVDLSNFYSRLVRSGLGEPRELRDYFLDWLDFDLLSTWLTSEDSPPTWVFYSGQRLGAKSERIDGDYLKRYIKRISRLKGVTPYDVQIPGDQREAFTVSCEECGKTGTAQWESEKGVDSSLIVHLFDTSSSWEEAVLLSGDADFIPAVRSLRRQGKRVSGAGFPGTSEALIRELHHFADLVDEIIRDDFIGYLLFKTQGIIDHWLSGALAADQVITGKKQVSFSCGWMVPHSDHEPQETYLNGRRIWGRDAVQIVLEDQGMADLSERLLMAADFQKRFPDCCVNKHRFTIPRRIWEQVQRRLPVLLDRFDSAVTTSAGKINSVFTLGDDGCFTRSDRRNNKP